MIMIIEYLIHGLEFNKSNPTSLLCTIERMTVGSYSANPCWIPHYKSVMSWAFGPRCQKSYLKWLKDLRRITYIFRYVYMLSSKYRISAPCTLQCLRLPIYDTKSYFLWPDVILQTHRFMEEQDADPTENPPMPCTKRNKAPKVGPADIPNEQMNWRIAHFPKSSDRGT